MTKTLPTCPICNGPLPTDPPEPYDRVGPSASGRPSDARYAPFCSSRCKLVDLSRWLGEEYRVPGPPLGDGVDSFAPDAHDDEGEYL